MYLRHLDLHLCDAAANWTANCNGFCFNRMNYSTVFHDIWQSNACFFCFTRGTEVTTAILYL